jgi:hypothetical protein
MGSLVLDSWGIRIKRPTMRGATYMLMLAATALVVLVSSSRRYTLSCFAIPYSQLCMFLLNLIASGLVFSSEVCKWNPTHSCALYFSI